MLRIKATGMLLTMALLASLAGCMFVGEHDLQSGGIVLLVDVARGTRSAILRVVNDDGTPASAAEFHWDLGYGDPRVTTTTTGPVLAWTFPEETKYAVVVTAVGTLDDGDGGDGAPGPGGHIGPQPGDGVTRSAGAFVDLSRGGELVPVIVMISFTGDRVTAFLPWTKATFSAAGSVSPVTPVEECTFRWEIEIYVFHGPAYEEGDGLLWTGPDVTVYRFFSAEMDYTIPQIPGPGGCEVRPADGRVRLTMWDAFGNSQTTGWVPFLVGYPQI